MDLENAFFNDDNEDDEGDDEIIVFDDGFDEVKEKEKVRDKNDDDWKRR